MNWGALKALAKVYVHRSDLDFDGLGALVASNISVALLVQENEATAALTMSGPNGNGFWSGVLPDDYATMRAVSQGGRALGGQAFSTLINRDTSCYAISGLKLYTAASGDVSLVYSARVDPLVGDSSTSVLLDRYPDIFLYGLLKHAAAVMQDPEINTEFYEQQFLGAIKTANSLYVDAAFGPGTMSRPMGGLA